MISFIGFINIIIRGDIINLGSFNFVVGDIWMLGCVSCWALYSSLVRKIPKEIDNMSFLFLIFFIGNMFVLPFYLFESHIYKSYLINEEGQIEYIFDKVKTKTHACDVLQVITN